MTNSQESARRGGRGERSFRDVHRPVSLLRALFVTGAVLFT
jgi:hypothetical protein